LILDLKSLVSIQIKVTKELNLFTYIKYIIIQIFIFFILIIGGE